MKLDIRDLFKLTVPECLHLLSIEPDIANKMELYKLVQNNQIDNRTFRSVIHVIA